LTLTAVEEFARLHDAGDLPDNAEHYRTLLPTALPAEGEQYAFAVDLDTCTGCKACVVACHSLNGLDDDESWRSVGLIQGGREVAFQQTVTTACHHCVEPACLSGCPVDAYEKDPVTGIVAHLDDQCIGCSYCTLTCPYEVPRFNKSRGIVRKCDMCRGRLAEGEAPACVQACPNAAISITIVSKEAVRERSAVVGATLVPGAPQSSLTTPTTTYTSTREMPDDARAADHFALRPAHAHPPLAVMLVLTQLAVGTLAFDVALRATGSSRGGQTASAITAATGLLALLASTLHLGRPLYAWRAVLGIGHSWLSREIVAFGVFAVTAPMYAITGSTVVGAGALGAGLAGVWCSVMLYAVTGRAWWRRSRSALTFALSGMTTGGVVSSVWLFGARSVPTAQTVALLTGCAATVKWLLDASTGWRRSPDDIGRAARLLRGDLRREFRARLLLLAFGGVGAPFVVAAAVTAPTYLNAALTMAASSILVVAAELIERNHFFQVAVAPRMPGELR
jgi:formate dehydrogenase iron-sulfur subunit